MVAQRQIVATKPPYDTSIQTAFAAVKVSSESGMNASAANGG